LGKLCGLGPVGFPKRALNVAVQRFPFKPAFTLSPKVRLDYHLVRTVIPNMPPGKAQPRSFPQQRD